MRNRKGAIAAVAWILLMVALAIWVPPHLAEAPSQATSPQPTPQASPNHENKAAYHLTNLRTFPVEGIQQLWFSGGRLLAMRVTNSGKAEIYEWEIGKDQFLAAQKKNPFFTIEVSPPNPARTEDGSVRFVAANDDPPVIAWARAGVVHVRRYKPALEIERDVNVLSQPRELLWGGDSRIAIRYDREIQIRDRGNQLLFSRAMGPYDGRYPIRRSGTNVGVVDAQAVTIDQIETSGQPTERTGSGSEMNHRSFSIPSSAFSVFLVPPVDGGWPRVVISRSDGTLEGLPSPIHVGGEVRTLVPLSDSTVIVAGNFPGLEIASTASTSVSLQSEYLPGSIRFLAWDGQTKRLVLAGASAIRLYDVSTEPLPVADAEKSSTDAQTVTYTPWIPVGLTAAVFALIPIVYLYVRGRRKKTQEIKTEQMQSGRNDRATNSTAFPDPVPPPELIEVCARGDCILFAGSGLSARAGMPIWRDFVGAMLAWARKHEFVDESKYFEQLEALSLGEANAVADNVVSAFGANRNSLLEFVNTVSGRGKSLPSVCQTITRIPFLAALTTNLDDLLERAYGPKVEVYAPQDGDALNKAADQRNFYLLKLYGTPQRPDTLVLSPAAYKAMADANLRFSRFIDSLFFSNSVLFIGASLEGIETFLASFTIRTSIPRQHFALVAVNGGAWRVKAEALQRRYKIQVIPYTATEGYPQVETFLKELQVRVAESALLTPDKSRKRSRLVNVHLKDIGPFHDLSLPLIPEEDTQDGSLQNWIVLLGDNGVGKSTILKSIAAVVAGPEAKEFAGPLVRSGTDVDFGSIRVTTDSAASGYEMRIDRDGDSVEVDCKPGEFVKKERTLILGFGPLRSVSRNRPRGPQAQDKGLLSSADVLPLLRGEADPRMDKLKQWIVNLNSNSQAEKLKGNTDNQHEKLLSRFQLLTAKLAPGLKIKSITVSTNFQAWVELPDGAIPIESLSQGATALLGWVGVLLQRMYEVYFDPKEPDADPLKRHAVVLIDEIDAHMHPAWQQGLAHRLTAQFPNVQFVVTTHSPFVVAGMPVGQVIRLKRNKKDEVVRVQADEDMTLGRADQILTGDLFGLETTLDQKTQELITKYQELLSKKKRSPDEDDDFTRLGMELEQRVPVSGETPMVRRAQELVKIVIDGDHSTELKEKAQQLARVIYRDDDKENTP